MTEPGSAPLAHSAGASGAPQTYADHVRSVTANAERYAAAAAAYRADPADRERFIGSVKAAAAYHDLGKLHDENQRVLRAGPGGRLPVNHVDAGAAHLLRMREVAAALLVYAHHIGLPSLMKELEEKGKRCFRDLSIADRTDREVDALLAYHERIVGGHVAANPGPADGTGLWRRIALSCLVDADHSDTARHDYGIESRPAPSLRPAERLRSLDAYVEGLGQGGPRDRIRAEIYRACRESPIEPAVRSCDSPVGTGKTTAVMAHLLRAAEAKGLRRVFVVLPFTNIIDQSVDVYRRSIILPGEEAEAVVAPHHHRADFSEPSLRHLAARWDAPVVVTTAVQFFETMAGNTPSALRRLHQVVGSAVFIDEAHAALPAHLWPQAWRWICELADDWGCHFVLGSGSLSRFWTLPEFADPPADVPELVPEAPRREAAAFETSRIHYRRVEEPLDLDGLVRLALESPGPCLVVLNTVQSAAVVADALRKKIGRDRVEHLSTALCPCDRKPVVDKVRGRLRGDSSGDWLFVATSCVEAGLDLSFRTAIRESCGLVNLVQIGGRVNREAEYQDGEVIDVRLDDPLLPPHPAFKVSSRVLADLFADGEIGPGLVTEAMRREIRLDPDKRGQVIVEREAKWDYPEVARLFRVIDIPTLTAVVDKGIVERLEKGEHVSWMELQKTSVQVWGKKAANLPFRTIRGHNDLLAWEGEYDGFLGYMAGVLKFLKPAGDAFIV